MGNKNTLKGAPATHEMVRYIQRHARFSNKELGDIFGVSRRSIQNWASGSIISESNNTKIGLFYSKVLSFTDLAPEELRVVFMSHADGESFVQAFKRSMKRPQKMLATTPIEARFA